MFGRYIKPYEILEQIRPVAYRVALPLNLADVHDVFHVSLLRKCISDPDTVMDVNQPKVQPNLTIAEYLIRITDHKEKMLRNKTIKYVKVLWSGQTGREVTWEFGADVRKKYPELFQ